MPSRMMRERMMRNSRMRGMDRADMADGRRGRRGRGRDRADNRDMRDRDMRDRDMRDYGDMDYDRGSDYGDSHYGRKPRGYGSAFYGRYGNKPFEMMEWSPMEEDYRDYGYYGDYADYGDYNDYADYGYYNDYGDYASGEKLSKGELKQWSEKLMKQIDEKDKDMLQKDKILKRAEEMGIKFEEYKPDEFYTTVLMRYTDDCKTLGNANLDLYISLAKNWLEDKDAKVKNGEKLATYYDSIVMGK